VLGVGTREGAPIPSGSGFVSAADGSVVIARLENAALARVADAGRGRYSTLDSGATATSPWLDAEGSAFSMRDNVLGDRWKDTGPWLVVLLLPAVAAGFRRGLLFLLPLCVLPGLMLSNPAQAGLWDDLWQRRDQQAQEALRDQDVESAVSLARDPEITGEAWYRAGEYQRAQQAWSQSQSADAHYNRGNALARAGEFDNAIAAYDAALERDPEMQDALFNRALVEQLKKQQEQQQQQGQQQQEGEGESREQQQEGESADEREEQEGDSQDQQQQEGQQSQQQAEQELEQTWSEEDAQAMEQWLRRIPDDPGGLLRRKFRNQHLQRGAPPDEEKTW
jgi:Ca-activated chloride channel family protein